MSSLHCTVDSNCKDAAKVHLALAMSVVQFTVWLWLTITVLGLVGNGPHFLTGSSVVNWLVSHVSVGFWTCVTCDGFFLFFFRVLFSRRRNRRPLLISRRCGVIIKFVIFGRIGVILVSSVAQLKYQNDKCSVSRSPL